MDLSSAPEDVLDPPEFSVSDQRPDRCVERRDDDQLDDDPLEFPDHRPFTEEFVPVARVDLVTEVRQPEFPQARRGYDRAAVDSYVARVGEVVEELLAVSSPNAAVDRALGDVADQTAAILREAQDTAARMTARAEREARERVSTARTEATGLREAAEQRVLGLDEDAVRLVREHEHLIGDIRRLGEQILAVADNAEERTTEARPQVTEALS